MATECTENTKEGDRGILELCDKVSQIAFDLQVYLKHGHLEKVYENGLANRLQKTGLKVEEQHKLQVCDKDGTVLGDFFADLFVDNRLIIELKACKALADEHTAQTLGCLRASGHRHALLINWIKQDSVQEAGFVNYVVNFLRDEVLIK